MTTKLVQDGTRIHVTVPTGGYTVNKAYLVGELVGVATETVAAAGTAALATEGVFTLTKMAEANSAVSQGGTVYGRTTGGEFKCGAVASGDNVAGTAWAAAVTGATTITVKLAGHALQDLV